MSSRSSDFCLAPRGDTQMHGTPWWQGLWVAYHALGGSLLSRDFRCSEWIIWVLMAKPGLENKNHELPSIKVDPPHPINTQINPLITHLVKSYSRFGPHNAHAREKNPCSSTFPGVLGGLVAGIAPTNVLGMVGQPPTTTRHHYKALGGRLCLACAQ